jgi:hypothetical protein
VQIARAATNLPAATTIAIPVDSFSTISAYCPLRAHIARPIADTERRSA